MAQFDIYPNPSKAQRTDIPWIVDIQTDLLSALQTRLVIPLALRKSLPAEAPRNLCPPVSWNGESLVALPHLAAAFRTKDLGRASGSLRSHASELVDAIDAVISGV
ncbi:MAG TPA: CcdB family protein [Variovorax sp.]|nr:CcdB family protein [Variovorax sp.]